MLLALEANSDGDDDERQVPQACDTEKYNPNPEAHMGSRRLLSRWKGLGCESCVDSWVVAFLVARGWSTCFGNLHIRLTIWLCLKTSLLFVYLRVRPHAPFTKRMQDSRTLISRYHYRQSLLCFASFDLRWQEAFCRGPTPSVQTPSQTTQETQGQLPKQDSVLVTLNST